MSGDVDVLEAELNRWCAQFDVAELMHLLQARGIAAGAVCSASAGITHPHLTARFTPMHHPYLGVHLYNGFPYSVPQRRPGNPRPGSENTVESCSRNCLVLRTKR